MTAPDPTRLHDSVAYLVRSGPVYIATPYTLRADKLAACAEAVRWQTWLAEQGFTGVSPIVLGHVMPLDWPHHEWMRWAIRLLDACPSVFVPPMAGRWESVGVRAEVNRALEHQKPVVALAG